MTAALLALGLIWITAETVVADLLWITIRRARGER
jgi:hypothetical protein